MESSGAGLKFARRSTATPTPVPAANVPESILACIFADRLTPRESVLGKGVDAPLGAVKVQKKALGTLLFAVAFWNLRQDGVLSLEYHEQKRFLGTRKRVLVHLREDAEAEWLEGAVLESLTGIEGDHVRDVVGRWFGQDVSDPFGDVIRSASDGAVKLGYLRNATNDRPAARFGRPHVKFEPVTEHIAALEPAFTRFAFSWRRFEDREPELYTALLDACRKGITDREEIEEIVE